MQLSINHELDKIWEILPNETKLPISKNDPKFHLEVCRMVRRYFIKQAKSTLDSQSSTSAVPSMSQHLTESQTQEQINRLLVNVYNQFKNENSGLSEEQLNTKILESLKHLQDSKSNVISQILDIKQKDNNGLAQTQINKLAELRKEIVDLKMNVLQFRQKQKRENVTMSYLMIQTMRQCSQGVAGFSKIFASTQIEYPDSSIPPQPTTTSVQVSSTSSQELKSDKTLTKSGTHAPNKSNNSISALGSSQKRPLSTSNIHQKETLNLSDIQAPTANSARLNTKRAASSAGKKIGATRVPDDKMTQSRIDSQQQKKIQRAIIDEQNQQIKDLINEYNQQQEEIEILSQQVQDVNRLNMRVTNQQRKIDDLQKQLSQKNSECVDLQQKLEVTKKQQQLLKNQVNKMLENKSGAADVIAENSRLNQQNQEIQSKYQEVCDENGKIYVIIEENEKTIAVQEQELEELREYIQACEENLRINKEELDKCVQQLQEAQKEVIDDTLYGRVMSKIKQKIDPKYIAYICFSIFVFLLLILIVGQVRIASCKRQVQSISDDLNSNNKLLDEAVQKEQLTSIKCNQTIEQEQLKQQVSNQQYESKIKTQWAMVGGSSVLSAVLLVVTLVKK